MGAPDTRIGSLGRRVYIWRLRRSKLRAAVHALAARAVVESYTRGWLVDVGCGPGLLGKALAASIPPQRIIGVDPDRGMLRIARRTGVEVVQAISSHLPFRDQQVMIAISTASLKDWGNPVAGLTEIARVLEPRGKGLIFDFVSMGLGSDPPGFRRKYGYVSDLLRRLSRFFAPFSRRDAVELIERLPSEASARVELEPELGAVRITLVKAPD